MSKAELTAMIGEFSIAAQEIERRVNDGATLEDIRPALAEIERGLESLRKIAAKEERGSAPVPSPFLVALARAYIRSPGASEVEGVLESWLHAYADREGVSIDDALNATENVR